MTMSEILFCVMNGHVFIVLFFVNSDNNNNELRPVGFTSLPEDAMESDIESDDSSEQGLQHTEDADDALVNMLQLKVFLRNRSLILPPSFFHFL